MDFDELDDLSLLIDSNLDRVSRFQSIQASSYMPLPETDCVENNVSPVNTTPEPIAQASMSPLLATASLSLALNSAISSKIFSNSFPKASALPCVSGATSAGLVSVVPSKNRNITGVRSHSPVPVMSSFEAQTKLDYSSLSSQPLKNVPKNASAFPDLLRLPSKGHFFRNPASCPAARKAAIVWFRSDLRIHDNEALVSANNDSLSILPVYCFDPRDYGKSSSGFDKTGPYRAKFLLECVSDLRDNLRKRGSDLIVRIGKPEEVLVKLAKAIGADALYAHQEVTYEELQSENKVSSVLKEEGIETKLFWGSTLYHLEDLPFSLETMPSNYGGFRETVKNIKIRETAETPSKLKGIPARGNVKAGDIPTLQQLGLSPANLKQDGSNVSSSALEGGETEALRRLERFVMEAKMQNAANNTVNGKKENDKNGDSLYGANFSCKISPWLAMGCLSPRKMYEDLSSKSNIHASSVNTSDSAQLMGASAVSAASAASATATATNDLNWLVFELLWRDFFRFITKKYGSGRKVASAAPVANAAV